MKKKVELTDFERDITISLLETALSGWDGQQVRLNAAQRVVDKLRALDQPAPKRKTIRA